MWQANCWVWKYIYLSACNMISKIIHRHTWLSGLQPLLIIINFLFIHTAQPSHVFLHRSFGSITANLVVTSLLASIILFIPRAFRLCWMVECHNWMNFLLYGTRIFGIHVGVFHYETDVQDLKWHQVIYDCLLVCRCPRPLNMQGRLTIPWQCLSSCHQRGCVEQQYSINKSLTWPSHVMFCMRWMEALMNPSLPVFLCVFYLNWILWPPNYLKTILMYEFTL